MTNERKPTWEQQLFSDNAPQRKKEGASKKEQKIKEFQKFAIVRAFIIENFELDPSLVDSVLIPYLERPANAADTLRRGKSPAPRNLEANAWRAEIVDDSLILVRRESYKKTSYYLIKKITIKKLDHDAIPPDVDRTNIKNLEQYMLASPSISINPIADPFRAAENIGRNKVAHATINATDEEIGKSGKKD